MRTLGVPFSRGESTLMQRLLSGLLLVSSLVTVCRDVAAQPPKGSQLSPDENACAMCHGEVDLWSDDKLHLFISTESLAEDVHLLKGVNCHDCHGGDPTVFDPGDLHAKEDGFRELTDIRKTCAHCHSETLTGVHATATETGETAATDQTTPLDCSKCHGEKAHSMLAATDSRSPVFGENKTQACIKCHKEQAVAVVKGVHAKAGEKDERGRGTPLDCGKCHGEKLHDMLPVRDAQSPVFLDNQVQTCGGCHEEDLTTYKATVHGHGLYASGLLVTAVCADCHGAHNIYYAADKRSTLHAANVAETCSECHRFIQERLDKSVHGNGNGPGGATETPAPGGKMKHKPTCTSCHQGHHLVHPDSEAFQSQLFYVCGNCHEDLSAGYRTSLHGQLTQLGYGPAAKCSDCHGAHDILKVNDPASCLAVGQNRLKTCRQCHHYAVQNFSHFDPHASYKDKQRYPKLHVVYKVLLFPLNLAFGLCALHAILWFFRSFVHSLEHGRDRTFVAESSGLVRFERFHRIVFGILTVSTLGLMLTGMPLQYTSQSWARSLARGLGGFESTAIWHHFFAVLAMCACIAHLASGVAKIVRLRQQGTGWKTTLLGPDSPTPSTRDVKDLIGMMRWFFGLGEKPKFERWTYWEKSDYWALCVAVGVIVPSGLMLWFPNLFCRVLPGGALNVAKLVHSEVALYAASILFFIRFFNTHFRPEKFPMDVSVLTGLVSEEHFRKARPEYVERLRREGKLDQIRRPAPSTKRLGLVLFGGIVVISLGVALLAALLLVSLGK